MKLLDGKVAIVTGGTRGIGLAVVRKYLEQGATVVLCGSREETAKKAVETLKAEDSSYKVAGLWTDLCNPEEIKRDFENVKKEYGSIDILVNNAGISARESIFNYKQEDFQKIMDLNVNAVFYCSQAVAEIMKEQGGGVIINTSSMVSLYGQSTGCGYPTSKFAVNGLTKSLALELAPYQIRVNAVAPGVTRTDMVACLPKAIIQPLIDTIPLGRIGEPEEVADAFVFLGSDMSSYITGIVLSVDGAAKN